MFESHLQQEVHDMASSFVELYIYFTTLERVAKMKTSEIFNWISTYLLYMAMVSTTKTQPIFKGLWGMGEGVWGGGEKIPRAVGASQNDFLAEDMERFWTVGDLMIAST